MAILMAEAQSSESSPRYYQVEVGEHITVPSKEQVQMLLVRFQAIAELYTDPVQRFSDEMRKRASGQYRELRFFLGMLGQEAQVAQIEAMYPGTVDLLRLEASPSQKEQHMRTQGEMTYEEIRRTMGFHTGVDIEARNTYAARHGSDATWNPEEFSTIRQEIIERLQGESLK